MTDRFQPQAGPFTFSESARRKLTSMLERFPLISALYRSPSWDAKESVACFAPEADLLRIPKSGGVVIVTSRALRAAEGSALASALRVVRSDVKIMIHPAGVGESKSDLFIAPNDPAKSASNGSNIRAIREAIKWVKDGGALVISSGEKGKPDPTLARVIRKAKSPAVGVSLIERERKGAPLTAARNMEVRVGGPVPFERLAEFKSTLDVMAYMRGRALLLESAASGRRSKASRRAKRIRYEMIDPPQETEALIEEIENIPSEQVLVESENYLVMVAEAEQMPCLLEEIGRLREIAFRQAGEGTGRSIDLDKFDAHYLHLLLWNRDKCEVVGAYRLGQTDLILKLFGVRGLYTSTLFDYKAELIESLGPALEMGRSFVRPEYQKSFQPLFLLWKGIGRYVAMEPRYRMLFGPVSISDDYLPASRELMVEFLKAHRLIPEMARRVRARSPFRINAADSFSARATAFLMRDIEEVAEVIAEIEGEQKGVPVLLRQYLKLGGRIIDFNLDHSFSDTLDGLILVDLARTDRRVLERFMSGAGAARFLDYHKQAGAARMTA